MVRKRWLSSRKRRMEFGTETQRRGRTRTRTLELPIMNFTRRTLTSTLQFARWGVEALNGFIGHLSQVEELQCEEGIQEEITQLRSLIRGRPIENNSSGNLRIYGSLNDWVAKTLIYGKRERKSVVYLGIGKIKKALSDIANPVKNGQNWEGMQYQEKKREIVEKVRMSKSRVVVVDFI